MARRAGSSKTPREAPNAASHRSGLDRRAKTPGLALPGDLGRSLRLLDDARLDRLAEAVADEVRRRGRNAPDRATEAGRSPKRTPAKAAGARPDGAAVTAGQERLILAALDAGLKPAVIAKEFRVSRSTVQRVITDAKGKRRGTER